jgi:tetratricopeptide (TPR) repeat protein
VSAVCLLDGCGGAVKRRYRTAELLLAEGKPELAAAEYERIVQNHARHDAAADALFKLGYICRVHTDEPDRAIEYYRKLAGTYPRSRYADEALLWLASLGRLRGDTALARQAVSDLETHHSDEPGSCAAAQVQLALALLAAGKPEVRAVCETILKGYPDQTHQCAQAQLILARAAQRLDKDQEAAVKQYEAVLAKYPDTMSAVEAKREIGWIYYGTRPAEPKEKPAGAAAPRKKLIAGVPPFARGPQEGIQFLTLDALRSLLKQSGTDTDINALMAVSGTAFQLVYAPQNPAMGAAAFATNPFETAASTFGYSACPDWSSTPEDAMLSLCQTLDRDRPALLPYSKLGWVVVIGYDQGTKQFIYLRPGAAGQRAESFDDFAARWKQACEEAGGALDPFYQFSLGPRPEKQGPPQPAELVRRAASLGLSLLHRTPVLGAPAGLSAYQALAADLDLQGSDLLPRNASGIALWGKEPLSVLRAGRRSAAQFLSSRAQQLPEPMRGQAQAAAATYQELDAKLGELQAAFPEVPPGARPETPAPDWAASASSSAEIVREAMTLESAAAQHLTALASE